MKTVVRNFVNTLDKKTFTNNTQRVLFQLLKAVDGPTDGWVVLDKFLVGSPGSRLRDLRKVQFGGFNILCRSASRVGKSGRGQTYYYKLGQRNLTVGKLKKVFGNV